MPCLRIILLCLVFTGAVPAVAEELSYSLLPVAFVVAPPSEPPNKKIPRSDDGGVKYSSTFRMPVEAEGGVTVDCDSTHWIGVAYILQKTGNQRIPRKSVYVRHEWNHSDTNIRNRNLDHRNVRAFYRSENAKHEWETLALKGKFETSGTWTLRSYVNAEQAFEVSFNLIGCESDEEFEYIPAPEEMDTPNEKLALQEPEPIEIVCSKEKPTGSHRKTTVCRTRALIDSRRESDQDMIQDLQRSTGNNRPP